MSRFYFRQLLSGRDFAKADPIAGQMVNFVYLIGDRDTGECVAVDPAYGVDDILAIVEADGSLTLLGRGSNCINTAGEKVYPEEVEEAVKSHPDVVDCLVVGIEDEKFGQRVTGVASLRPGSETGTTELREFTKQNLAAYKVPKDLFIVESVQRAPNGKADYGWARKAIEEALSS